MTRRRWLRRAVLAFVAGAVITATAGAQRPTPRPTKPTPRPSAADTLRTRSDSLRARGDTLRPLGDSLAARDTAGRPNFAPADSVMQRLLDMPGYNTTRYEGERITFDATSRATKVTDKAMVLRDSQLVKSDTIEYMGSGGAVRVGSDPSKLGNVFVGPGQAPIFTRGTGTYDMANRSLSGGGLKTRLDQAGQTLNITGERYKIVAAKDSVASKDDMNYYFLNGTVTACDDSVPDYYFKAHEIKRTGSFVVARPAVLYIGDVPVLWLPFLFQDIRNGRRSGLIAPNVGVSDIVRNSKSYRRNVDGLGYYVAISDYMDAQASLDWRSSAGEATPGDPGYMRYNGEFRYHWLERYVTGNLAVAQTLQAGATNTAVSWGHQQNFTRNSSLSSNINYVTSTTIQRQTTVNPYSVVANIGSQVNYQEKVGPLSLSLGGRQTQYMGRSQLDRTFPTLSLSTSPLSIGEWLVWTPGFTYTSTQARSIDQQSSFGVLARLAKTAAGLDTLVNDTLSRNQYTSSLSFQTPLQIFGYNLGNQFSVSAARNDFPEREIITDVVTGVETQRIYAQTYKSSFDWTPQFTLPPLARNNFNLSPSLSFANVEGQGAFMIRNERTNGQWVRQSKRPTFGLSASPTLYSLFSGFGPFQAIRHSISPTVGYGFAPASNVSDEYLAALGLTRFSKVSGQSGYLGALAQNSISFGLSTNFEARMRSLADSNPQAGEKLKLLSLNFSSVNYDFERARATHSRLRGLTTQNFGYTIRSDLLPGVDIGVDYSLFEGSTLSDSARFSPYRERVTGSFSFSNTANPFAVFSRLFSRAVPASAPGTDRNDPAPDERYARAVASQPVAGRAARTAAFLTPASAGWTASFTFTSARQRPLSGVASNVVEFDPALACAALNSPTLRLAYDQCVAQQRLNPPVQTPITSGLVGSPLFQIPPTTSLGSNLGFALTEHWTASWQTQYDFVAHNFASQIVSLQRDLHDWRAIFAFTQSPNGSFAFNFLVSLKAEPELKFDYHKSTYRNEGIGR